jgi:hypothetical protein
VVAGTTGEDAALASVRSLGFGSASHCGVGNDRSGRRYDLCSLGWRGLKQPMWWRKRMVKTLLWTLFARSAWAQPATVVVGKTVQGAALASVRLVGMDLESRYGRGHDR